MLSQQALDLLELLDAAMNTLEMRDLTDEEEDIVDHLEEEDFVRFFDDGDGYGADIVLTKHGKRALRER